MIKAKQKAQGARVKRVEKALVVASKLEKAASPPAIKVPVVNRASGKPVAKLKTYGELDRALDSLLLGSPFLLQVTPVQAEWLEAQRKVLGYRSRAETIRHWLQRAVEGRIE